MDRRKTVDALLMTPRDPRFGPICLCGYPCLADRVRDAIIAAYTDAFWRKVGQTGWFSIARRRPSTHPEPPP